MTLLRFQLENYFQEFLLHMHKKVLKTEVIKYHKMMMRTHIFLLILLHFIYTIEYEI